VSCFRLVNAEDRARDHFPMFQIPDLSTRRRLTTGMYVKLGFTDRDGQPDRARGERMWVQITDVIASDAGTIVYLGTLSNDPITFDDEELKRGDNVTFGPEHVMEWDVSEP
jgi:hypothetical protein